MKKVYVTDPVLPEVAAAIDRDFVRTGTLAGADGVVASLGCAVDDAFLDAAGPQLRIVANHAVGVNNVDLAAAERRGVVVSNTPDVLTRATAELAIGLILGLLRRIVEGDRLIRSRMPWQFALDFMLGTSLEGRTVGIVGPGRIGREVARLAEAFGARSIFAGRGDDLGVLLAASDIVSLHCPLTPQTTHLIGASELRHMRRHAVLVNTARGPIVDEAALVSALRSGAIAGAALDVHEFEPKVAEELLSLQQVVLTPHLGSATRSTRVAMGMLCVDALRAVLIEGRVPANAVVGK